MGKIYTIAAREFIETVRTKTFLLTTVLLPLVIIGLVFGAEWVHGLSEQTTLAPRQIAVVDESGAVLPHLRAQIAAFNGQNPARPFELVPVSTDEGTLRAAVSNGEYYAYLVIPAGAITGAEAAVLGRKDNQLQPGRQIERLLNNAVEQERFRRADPPVDFALVQHLQAPVPVEAVDVTTGARATGNELVRFMTPFAFMFLLFMGTFGISQGLLTSLIEEKSTRVVEVLLSAVSPLQLMAGKILGMVGVGLLLLAVWGGLGFGSARYHDMAYLVTVPQLVYAALYFVPAFLLYAALLGGIGAACNTLKEAQSMTFPLSIVTTVPLLLWFQISEHPTSVLSMVLSFVPPVTPFVMMLRLSADPLTPLWQVVATLGLLWLTVLAAIWAAAKVFRVGVLMYGQPPTPRELWRWVRRA
jgi:ABC-2 type transport system permease protein